MINSKIRSLSIKHELIQKTIDVLGQQIADNDVEISCNNEQIFCNAEQTNRLEERNLLLIAEIDEARETVESLKALIGQ